EDYAVIQKFFEYLASPEVQAEWHEKTFYMPVVVGVAALSEKHGFLEQGLNGKTAKLAINSYSSKAPSEYSRGILLPNFPKIRELMVQEMKETIRGHKSAEEALNQIVVRGNKILRETP